MTALWHVVPESAQVSGRVDLFRVNEANDALEHVRPWSRNPYDPTVFSGRAAGGSFGTLAPSPTWPARLACAVVEGPWEPMRSTAEVGRSFGQAGRDSVRA